MVSPAATLGILVTSGRHAAGLLELVRNAAARGVRVQVLFEKAATAAAVAGQTPELAETAAIALLRDKEENDSPAGMPLLWEGRFKVLPVARLAALMQACDRWLVF